MNREVNYSSVYMEYYMEYYFANLDFKIVMLYVLPGNSENLEDLLLTLHKQLSDSDWLKKNTAEKWVEENPELAKEYMEAAKKS